jgi:hypothetical protein
MFARWLSCQGVRVYEERYLGWELYRYDGVLVAGEERFAELVWLLVVKPTLLESDPGPLDARVS